MLIDSNRLTKTMRMSKKKRGYTYALNGRPSTHTHISTTHAIQRGHSSCLLLVCSKFGRFTRSAIALNAI